MDCQLPTEVHTELPKRATPNFQRGERTQRALRSKTFNPDQKFQSWLDMFNLIDLLRGLFRGAVFHHGGVPENCPLATMGRFPSLVGRFVTSMGRFNHDQKFNPGLRFSGTKFCTGDIAPTKPDFVSEFWETHFGRPNFGPEFLGRIF